MPCGKNTAPGVPSCHGKQIRNVLRMPNCYWSETRSLVLRARQSHILLMEAQSTNGRVYVRLDRNSAVSRPYRPSIKALGVDVAVCRLRTSKPFWKPMSLGTSEFKIHSRRRKHSERLLDADEVQARGPEADDVRIHVVIILVVENVEDLAGQRPLPRRMWK